MYIVQFVCMCIHIYVHIQGPKFIPIVTGGFRTFCY